MHHSDFNSHQFLVDSTQPDDEEQAAWIRKYNHRQAMNQRHQKQSFVDCILWIASIIMLLGVFNFSFVLSLFN